MSGAPGLFMFLPFSDTPALVPLMSVVGNGVATENTTVQLVVFLADRRRAAVRCGARGEGNSLSLVQAAFRGRSLAH